MSQTGHPNDHPQQEKENEEEENREAEAEIQIQRSITHLWQEIRELSLGQGSHVERIAGLLSPLRFLRDFVLPNKPCIITGAVQHWPALSKWTNQYLSSLLRHQTVSVHFTPNGRADSIIKNRNEFCFVSAFVERMEFPTALDYISGSKRGQRGVAYAQEQNGCFMSEYALLAADVEEDVPWATEALGMKPEAVNMWIGNEEAVTSFHKDHYENLYAVVAGEKHFVLLPPTDVHRMYVREYPASHYKISEETGEFDIELDRPLRYVPWSSVDPCPALSEVKQSRVLFPMYFNGPKPFECSVRAGEMLYLPSMWFHHVSQTPDTEGRTIAINYWYDMQYDIKYAYFNFLQNLSCPRIYDKQRKI